MPKDAKPAEQAEDEFDRALAEAVKAGVFDSDGGSAEGAGCALRVTRRVHGFSAHQ